MDISMNNANAIDISINMVLVVVYFLFGNSSIA
jgi:hypothetical protein